MYTYEQNTNVYDNCNCHITNVHITYYKYTIDVIYKCILQM